MGKPFITLLFILGITIVSLFITLTQTLPEFPKFSINIPIGAGTFSRDFHFKLGLDLVGGTSVTLRADMKDIPEQDRSAALDAAKNVIERRVNLFGVSEPLVQTARVGQEYRIVTELAGVTDANEAVNLIGKTANLEFWERNIDQAATDAAQFIPTDVTGKDMQRAFVSFDPNTGAPEVSFEFTSEGGKKFEAVTKRILEKPEDQRQLAIVLDGQLISAPVVNSVISDKGRITGQFTTDEVKELAIQLNAGALPVPMEVIEQRTIGATLGAESIQKSLIAGGIGFIIVMLFMAFMYGWYGLLANTALIIYALIVLAIFKLFPVTLTLAGIAGFILSIGMAVDANILIFERMKEEKRWGKARVAATELGFTRAWTSIRDSNISSLMTSGILYYFGTGVVRGFAITLAIGILVSMFSAIIVTRTFLRMLYK